MVWFKHVRGDLNGVGATSCLLAASPLRFMRVELDTEKLSGAYLFHDTERGE